MQQTSMENLITLTNLSVVQPIGEGMYISGDLPKGFGNDLITQVGYVILTNSAVNDNVLNQPHEEKTNDDPQSGYITYNSETNEYEYGQDQVFEGDYWAVPFAAQGVVVFYSKKDGVLQMYNIFGAPFNPALGSVGFRRQSEEDKPSNAIDFNVTKGESQIPNAEIEKHGDIIDADYDQVKGIYEMAADIIKGEKK